MRHNEKRQRVAGGFNTILPFIWLINITKEVEEEQKWLES